MDFGKLFSEAWKTTWKYKVLWIFGILSSCAASGLGGSGNFNFNLPSSPGSGSGRTPSGSMPNIDPGSVQRALDQLAPAMAAVGVVMCIGLLIGLIAWALGIIGRGALVAGAQQADDEGNTTFSRAWSAASAKFGSLLGMNLLLALPSIALAFVAVVIGILGSGAIIAAIGAASSGARTGGAENAAAASVLGLFACLIPLICIGMLIQLVTAIMRLFGERAIMLEGLGAMDGIKRGWAVFRANAGNSVLLGIILVVLSAILNFVLGLLFIPVVAPAALAAMSGAANGTAPNTAMIALSVCGALLLTVLVTVIQGALHSFCATCWTRTYRAFANPGAEVSAPIAPTITQL